MKATSSNIVINKINEGVVIVPIVGTSPLIVNRFTPPEKQLKGEAKKKYDPEKEYLNSIYFFRDGEQTGFPSSGFKMGMVRAAKQTNISMTDARVLFHVIPDEGGLVKIFGDHSMRSDRVVISRSAVMRYRAEYLEWRAILKIEYNEDFIDHASIINLVNLGGYHAGIGEMRPEKRGDVYGRYRVAVEKYAAVE